MNAANRPRDPNEFQNFRDAAAGAETARRAYLHSFLRDPLARFLVRGLRLSPWRAFFASFSLVALIYALRLAIHLFLDQTPNFLEKIWVDCLYDFILVPASYGFYIWLSCRLPYVSYRLSLNGVTWDPGKNNDDLNQAHHRALNHPALWLGALSVLLALLALHLVQFEQGNWNWARRPPDLFVFFLLKIPFTWLLPWYMVTVMVVKQAIHVIRFRRLFASPAFRVNLGHPDRCGGLKVFSDQLLRFTGYLMLCAFGIALLTYRGIRFGSFSRDYHLHAAILLYVPLCLLFFYYPLHPLRIRMQTWIREWLEKIRENPLALVGPYTVRMQRRFLAALFAPFAFFFFLKLISI